MEAPRVLVVDDHVDCVDTLVLVLDCVGYSARGAYTGAEALAIAKEWSPWAAILDLAMPSMNGPRRCQASGSRASSSSHAIRGC